MPTPLDELANSPRRFRNDDGSEVVSSSLVKLGPGIVASRPSGAPGEATQVTLDAPGVAALEDRVAALEALLGGEGTLTLDRLRVATIEAYSPGTIPHTLEVVVKNGEADEPVIVVAARTIVLDYPKLGFFGVGPVGQQQGFADTTAAQSRFYSYGLVGEVPA